MSVSFVDCYVAIDEGLSLAELLVMQFSFSSTALIFGEFCIEFADVHTVLSTCCEQSFVQTVLAQLCSTCYTTAAREVTMRRYVVRLLGAPVFALYH